MDASSTKAAKLATSLSYLVMTRRGFFGPVEEARDAVAQGVSGLVDSVLYFPGRQAWDHRRAPPQTAAALSEFGVGGASLWKGAAQSIRRPREDCLSGGWEAAGRQQEGRNHGSSGIFAARPCMSSRLGSVKVGASDRRRSGPANLIPAESIEV
jgi:hypothetical protein